MVIEWKNFKTLIAEEGDEIIWKRGGYDYVGIVVEVYTGNEYSYYVEYDMDPKTKSWTTVNQNELNIKAMTQRQNNNYELE